MLLTMKERYARLDLGKLPSSYKSEFDEMFSGTDGFKDEELNDIFAENFNEMYDLVEEKYPDAIKKGSSIKKTKPSKVKVIKPKTVLINKLSPEGIKKRDEMLEEYKKASGHKKLSVSDIEFIEDQLANNEVSTDEEMVEHFIDETGINEAQAKKWVALRDRYLQRSPEESIKYSVRTALKKNARKAKDTVKTRDGVEVNRKDPKNKGKIFYTEDGAGWKCMGYKAEADECLFEGVDNGKEMFSCLESMYVSDPVKKREKGNFVDECKETLKEAGYKVIEHKAGKKKIKRSAPRPEKEIIKERVGETFTPIMKGLTSSKEKEIENKEVITVLNNIESSFSKFMNRISNLADDGKLEQLKKIEKLLKELLD